MLRFSLLVLLVPLAACGSPPAAKQPEGEPLPTKQPLPPEVGTDGVFVDHDKHWSITLPVGSTAQPFSNALGMTGIAADVDRGVVTVVVWKPPHEQSVKQLDGFLDTYTKDGAVAKDVGIPGSTMGRGVDYVVHAPQPDAIGMAWALQREPYVYIVIVHGRTGTPFVDHVAETMASFKLL